MTQRLETHEERFAARVTIGPPEQCWLWEGVVLPHTGYAQFWPYGRAGGKVYAHRYAYERWIGPIPEGLTLDHACHTYDLSCPGGLACAHRRCVNPYHLEPVTAQAQTRRQHHWHQLDDGSWVCAKGHSIVEKPHLKRIYCRDCFNITRAAWRKRKGWETPTPGALERRAARRSMKQAQSLFGEESPLLGEVERLGLREVKTRLSNGQQFIDGQWHRPK